MPLAGGGDEGAGPPLLPTLLGPPVLEGGFVFIPLPPVAVGGREVEEEDVPVRGAWEAPTPDFGTAELVVGVGTRDIATSILSVIFDLGFAIADWINPKSAIQNPKSHYFF
jgi:hypothetical protein